MPPASRHARRPHGALVESALVRLAAQGDADAFAAIMRTHNRPLFRVARAILKDDAEAEDALQEAYIRAYRSLSTYRGEAQLSTWLARVVVNEALMRLRKRERRNSIVPLQPGVDLQDANVMEIESKMENPENAARRAEVRRLLEARIDALPDVYRAVFMLRAVEEYSVEETAAILDVPEATVRTRFFRARSLLREGLASEVDMASGEAFGFAGERCDRIVASVLARLSRAT